MEWQTEIPDTGKRNPIGLNQIRRIRFSRKGAKRPNSELNLPGNYDRNRFTIGNNVAGKTAHQFIFFPIYGNSIRRGGISPDNSLPLIGSDKENSVVIVGRWTGTA